MNYPGGSIEYVGHAIQSPVSVIKVTVKSSYKQVTALGSVS